MIGSGSRRWTPLKRSRCLLSGSAALGLGTVTEARRACSQSQSFVRRLPSPTIKRQCVSPGSTASTFMAPYGCLQVPARTASYRNQPPSTSSMRSGRRASGCPAQGPNSPATRASTESCRCRRGREYCTLRIGTLTSIRSKLQLTRCATATDCVVSIPGRRRIEARATATGPGWVWARLVGPAQTHLRPDSGRRGQDPWRGDRRAAPDLAAGAWQSAATAKARGPHPKMT